MFKHARLLLLCVTVALLWTATAQAAVSSPGQPRLPLQNGEASPQGAGMLVLLMGIGAILLVGAVVLTRRANDSGGEG